MSGSALGAARVPPSHARMSTWRIGQNAIVLYRLELEHLRRSPAIPWLFGGWAVICLGVLVLPLVLGDGPQGPWVFSLLGFAAVTASVTTGSLHSALTAFRDRSTGGLTILRSTHTVPSSLLLGRLMAAVCLATVWSLVPSVLAVVTLFMGVSPVRLGGLVLVCVVFAVTSSALSLGLALAFSRPRRALAVALAAVAALSLGSVGAYRATLPLVTSAQRVESYWQIGPGQPCIFRLTTVEAEATNHTWWLMLASPYVGAADILSGGRDAALAGASRDLLLRTQTNVRDARTGPAGLLDQCDDGVHQPKTLVKAPNWPYTVLVNVALALLGVFWSIRALSTPSPAFSRSRRGQRITAG